MVSLGNSERISTLRELVDFDPVPRAIPAGHYFRAPVTRHCPGSAPEAVAPVIVVERAGHRVHVEIAFDDTNHDGRIEAGVDAILLNPVRAEKIGPVVLGDGLDPQEVCNEALRKMQGAGRR